MGLTTTPDKNCISHAGLSYHFHENFISSAYISPVKEDKQILPFIINVEYETLWWSQRNSRVKCWSKPSCIWLIADNGPTGNTWKKQRNKQKNNNQTKPNQKNEISNPMNKNTKQNCKLMTARKKKIMDSVYWGHWKKKLLTGRIWTTISGSALSAFMRLQKRKAWTGNEEWVRLANLNLNKL